MPAEPMRGYLAVITESEPSAALTVGTKLLSGLMLDHRKDADDLFAPLRPHMGEFIRTLKQRNSAA